MVVLRLVEHSQSKGKDSSTQFGMRAKGAAYKDRKNFIRVWGLGLGGLNFTLNPPP